MSIATISLLIPTLILFKDGQEIDRVVGYAPQRVLEEKLNAALN